MPAMVPQPRWIDVARFWKKVLGSRVPTRPSYLSRLPHNPYEGEMTDYERFKLYQWLNRRRPGIVFEVGTGVGGSTFYICKSLQAHGGRLYTCDPARRPPDRFLNEFAGVLDYRQLESTVMIGQLIGQGLRPDFIFFDGPEIPELALQDLNLLEQVIAPGTQFAMHDWHLGRRGYDGGQSIKAALVRPYLENSPEWRMLEVLRGDVRNSRETRGPYDSVGLCLYERSGKVPVETLSRR